MILYEQEIYWFVVFHPGRTWWSRDFRHVSLLGHHDETWLWLDTHRRGVDAAMVFRFSEKELLWEGVRSEHTIVDFGVRMGKSKRHFGQPLTCVSFVKHALGFNSGALRPDGLFRDLVHVHKMSVINEAENISSTKRRGSCC